MLVSLLIVAPGSMVTLFDCRHRDGLEEKLGIWGLGSIFQHYF